MLLPLLAYFLHPRIRILLAFPHSPASQFHRLLLPPPLFALHSSLSHLHHILHPHKRLLPIPIPIPASYLPTLWLNNSLNVLPSLSFILNPGEQIYRAWVDQCGLQAVRSLDLSKELGAPALVGEWPVISREVGPTAHHLLSEFQRVSEVGSALLVEMTRQVAHTVCSLFFQNHHYTAHSTKCALEVRSGPSVSTRPV